jgi:tetratricopeptide (TPR) repeat protein
VCSSDLPLPPGRIAVNKLETDGIEHMRLGELAEAERDLMAALKQREAIYSDDAEHPQLACALNNLAVLHLKQHRLEEAAAGFERVVRIKELVQRHTPSSRTLLEITAARNNLDAVRRFQAREAPPLHSTVLPPQCAG